MKLFFEDARSKLQDLTQGSKEPLKALKDLQEGPSAFKDLLTLPSLKVDQKMATFKQLLNHPWPFWAFSLGSSQGRRAPAVPLKKSENGQQWPKNCLKIAIHKSTTSRDSKEVQRLPGIPWDSQGAPRDL